MSLPTLQATRIAGFSVLLSLLLGLGLLWLPAWHTVELKVFDLLSIATAPRKSSLPITIIGIDEASFTQLGKRWPWPRDMHARLVDKLAASRASVIAFDMLFPEESAPDEDQAFAEAIRRAGNVVLAADHTYHETASARQWLRVDPIPQFTGAGAVTGLATAVLDGDAVVRLVPETNDALWRQAIRMLIRTRPGSVEEPYVAPGAMMRHLGPAHTFPYVSYYQVLNGDPSIPANFFEDQIVMIGRDVRAALDSGSAQAETFATPFMHSTKQLVPGVEIHATLIENALMGQTLQPASRLHDLLVLGGGLLLVLPMLAYWHPLRSALLVLLVAAAAAGGSYYLFQVQNVWQSTATPLFALVAAFVSTGAGSYWTERRRATEIRSAFEKYVSTDVVREMVAHPEKLRLGGERRELTVLFGDLAGFTSMSEKLAPEAVADLINLYLNAATRIVMEHGGTVDKFIGDAVMAFWGAPLEDREHALHATRAALALQDAMDQLQPRFAALGAEQVGLRIGLHSGPAIVGNMGSDLRFNYTALGDTVNLASRLEGVNKAYGTRILLSSDTAQLLRNEVPLRPVDRVRVKGKNVPVDIYTPCRERSLAEQTTAAWKAYLARDWPAATQAWQGLAAQAPADPLPQLFTERIAAYVAEPPPGDWDGAVSLEKL